MNEEPDPGRWRAAAAARRAACAYQAHREDLEPIIRLLADALALAALISRRRPAPAAAGEGGPR